MSSFPECPICHKRLEDWATLRLCPTKVLIQYGDTIRQRNHYEEVQSGDQCKTYTYPPFRITVDPIGDDTTDIYQLGYQPDQPPNISRLILTLPISLNLPWDNEAAVRDALQLYLTFS